MKKTRDSRVFPSFITRKYFWQAILGALFIVFLIFFIRNERIELRKIKSVIIHANWLYVVAGITVTGIYIILQGWLYVWSYYTAGKKIPFKVAVRLFLKRNIVGILLPGGTFSSLAFYNKDLEQQDLSKTQQYLGSYIFGFASTVSIVIVALPAIILLFLKNELNFLEIAGFTVLILVILLMGWGFFSVINGKGRWVQKLLTRYKPEWIASLEEFANHSVSKRKLAQSCLISVGIEITGVLHLYIALLALNATPSLFIALAGYVIMVILMSFSPFLKGLGAIELSLTYLLVQFGYETAIAASVILLFRAFEFWLPLVAGIFTYVFRKDSLLIRLIPSLSMLVLGIVNIVSAITPAIPARLAMIQDLLPSGIADLSNFSILVMGIILIILSAYLFLGARNAWKLGLILTFASILGHLIKAVDYEEAILALVTFISLIYSGSSYSRKHSMKFQQKSFLRLLMIFIVVFIYAIAGFYLMDKIHFKREFSLSESVQTFFRMLFVFDNQYALPYTSFARDFLLSIRLAGAGLLIYLVWFLVYPLRQKRSFTNENYQLAIELVKKCGASRLDYFKTYFDKFLYFNEDMSAFLSYKLAENYAVVLEEPVACTDSIKRQIIKNFIKVCDENGMGLFFYRISEEKKEIFVKTGFHTLLIGQEAVVHLDNFTLSGGNRSSLRSAIHKIRNSGHVVKIYDPPIKDGVIQKLEHVSNGWLQFHKMSEIGFTQGVFSKSELKKTSVITLENPEEEIVAFVNLIPDFSGSEGTYDLIRYLKKAPNGSVDILMIEIFEYFKAKGYKTVNLGMAAFSGFEKGHTIQQHATYFIMENIQKRSRFKGLYDFKNKFDPEWMNKYLAFENSYDLLRFPMIMNKISKI
jgi:phosphatidylglycerol lysyltransferase